MLVLVLVDCAESTAAHTIECVSSSEILENTDSRRCIQLYVPDNRLRLL